MLAYIYVDAKVSGVCSNCHTMHNSQNGSAVSKDFDGTSYTLTTTPKDNLLVYNCVGCHSATDSSTWQDSFTQAPIVYNTSEPDYNTAKGLAAGNFFFVTQDQAKGHNVTAIPGINQDSNFTSTPGGTGSTCSACHGSGNMVLAKCVFCHDPAHHKDDSATLVGTDESGVGPYYRFLSFTYRHSYSFQSGKGFYGGQGIEDDDWEYTVSSTDHNEYAGAPLSGNSHSISKYCALCHGLFHGTSNTGSSSPFIRHPTDYALPTTGEYSAYTTYDPVAPVSRPDLSSYTGPSQTVTPGTDQVSCLSCHRVHGSPYKDILRWDYSDMIAGGGGSGGCFTCHTQKNQTP